MWNKPPLKSKSLRKSKLGERRGRGDEEKKKINSLFQHKFCISSYLG
jgi:hypothetical protein